MNCVIRMGFPGGMSDPSSTREEINEPNKTSFYPGHENKYFSAADIFVLLKSVWGSVGMKLHCALILVSTETR